MQIGAKTNFFLFMSRKKTINMSSIKTFFLPLKIFLSGTYITFIFLIVTNANILNN